MLPDGPVAPVIPRVPMAPVAPVAPVGPRTPCGPVGPGVPVGPVPAETAGPGGPCEPGSPLRPAAPDAPAGPVGPEGPLTPFCPGAPAGPVGPRASAADCQFRCRSVRRQSACGPTIRKRPDRRSTQEWISISPARIANPCQRKRSSDATHRRQFSTNRSAPVRFFTQVRISRLGASVVPASHASLCSLGAQRALGRSMRKSDVRVATQPLTRWNVCALAAGTGTVHVTTHDKTRQSPKVADLDRARLSARADNTRPSSRRSSRAYNHRRSPDAA
jgi:hypothetical protein